MRIILDVVHRGVQHLCEKGQYRPPDLHNACAFLCERPIDAGEEGLWQPHYAFGAGPGELAQEEAEEEEEHLSISQLGVRRKKVEPPDSICSLH